MKFTPMQRAAIRSKSGCDDATIKRYPNVRDASAMRIERAAQELGIPFTGVTHARSASQPPPQAA
jgi:hypothetical protein